MTSPITEVIGRERELAEIAAFVGPSDVRPVALVVVGEPGIGKSTLCERGCQLARDAGWTVLACRPSGAEVRLAYAVLDELVEDGLVHEGDALPVPQRRALDGALLLAESEEPVDPRAVGLAVLAGLRARASTGPVLVAIDDAHWLDEETLTVLSFVQRRLRHEPIRFLCTARPEGLDVVQQLLQGIRDDRRVLVDLAALSIGAVHRLLVHRLGLALPRPLLLRVHEASGGNPFYALEVARALAGRDEVLAPGAQLPVPPDLQELIARRLLSLPRGTDGVLLAVASTADPRTAVIEAVESQRAGSRLRAAVRAGIVRVDHDRVAFTHPLIGSVVQELATPEERRAMHRRLAEVVDDLEARARHLALGLSEPNSSVARMLDEAAGRARARGAPHAGAELWELAAQATPSDDATAQRRRRSEAADSFSRAGAFGRSEKILESLLEEATPGDERADLLVRLGRAGADLERALELANAAEREPVRDEAVSVRIHLALSLCWPITGLGLARREAELAVLHAERSGQQDLLVWALARLGLWQLWGGLAPGEALERAVALAETQAGSPGYEDSRIASGSALTLWRMYQGRLDEARSLLGNLHAEAANRGDEAGVIIVNARLADVELRAGAWGRADEYSVAAFELAEQIGLEHDGGFAAYMRALVHLHLGRSDEARRLASIGERYARAANQVNTQVMNQALLGYVEFTLGNEAEALPHVRPLLDWVEARELGLAPHPMVPHALEVLAMVGKVDEARRLTERFEREARVIESPWLEAVGARCRGVIAAASGELLAAVEAYEESLSYDPHSHWPFQRAYTLLLLGRTQRRLKRRGAAKGSLEDAIKTFDALPAPLWSERARAELQWVGARSAAGALTENERRVAELAATGLTNREIAGRLFLSPKTVEANLARAYRKLGIRTRAELGATFALAELRQAKT